MRSAAALQELAAPEDIATCPPVVEEVLRGARSEHDYRQAFEELRSMIMLDSPMELEVFEQAAVIYRTARAASYTIRSPFDCLIAACAIRHGVPVLHADRDFEYIARVTTLEQRYVAG